MYPRYKRRQVGGFNVAFRDGDDPLIGGGGGGGLMNDSFLFFVAAAGAVDIGQDRCVESIRNSHLITVQLNRENLTQCMHRALT